MRGVESCGPGCRVLRALSRHEDWKQDQTRDSAGLGTRPSVGPSAGCQQSHHGRASGHWEGFSVAPLFLQVRKQRPEGQNAGAGWLLRRCFVLLGVCFPLQLCGARRDSPDSEMRRRAPHSTLPFWHPLGQSVFIENQILSLIAITIFKQTNGCRHQIQDKNPRKLK